MSKKKGNAADLAPSRKEKKGIGQYVLGYLYSARKNTDETPSQISWTAQLLFTVHIERIEEK